MQEDPYELIGAVPDADAFAMTRADVSDQMETYEDHLRRALAKEAWVKRYIEKQRWSCQFPVCGVCWVV